MLKFTGTTFILICKFGVDISYISDVVCQTNNIFYKNQTVDTQKHQSFQRGAYFKSKLLKSVEIAATVELLLTLLLICPSKELIVLT